MKNGRYVSVFNNIYMQNWWLMRLKNQYCFASLFISCLIGQTGCLILYRASSSFHIAINSMISLWVHSLLPLLLFFFQFSTFRGRAQRCGGFHYWCNTTNCYSCSLFCTILLEFYSMCLCKISFPSSSNPRLPF